MGGIELSWAGLVCLTLVLFAWFRGIMSIYLVVNPGGGSVCYYVCLFYYLWERQVVDG